MRESFPDDVPELRATYNLDLETLKRAMLIFQRPILRPRRLILLVCGVTGAAALWVFLRLPALAIICALVFVEAAWSLPRRSLKAMMRVLRPETTPGLLGKHTIEVQHDSPTVSTECNRIAFKLEALESVTQHEDFLVILLSRGLIIAVPSDGDFGEHTFDGFCDRLTALWKASKDATPETSLGTV